MLPSSAPMIDLSYSVLSHFLITVLESLKIMYALKPMEIPNLIASNPARASAANDYATSTWSTDLDAKISPSTSRTINPEADLKYCWSKAASK
ncbi:hypothetical protein Gotri_015700 [Gossypium trilobum]|uniref:Uncharacterized protein n=1 Tax=Gossypium trilobum TaxID=34281 RepID=A0A7J9E0Z2_9ROSI|nr:hypothetical protein [Gossypium trilobum]